MHLPAELRNKIYAYAFDSASISPLYQSLWEVDCGLAHVAEDSRGLLLSCRQLRHEASRFLGTYIHLWWDSDLEFDNIRSAAGHDKASKLHSIRCNNLAYHWEWVPDWLEFEITCAGSFPSLRCVEIERELNEKARVWTSVFLRDMFGRKLELRIGSELDDFKHSSA